MRRVLIARAALGVLMVTAAFAVTFDWVNWIAAGRWLRPWIAPALMFVLGMTLLLAAVLSASPGRSGVVPPRRGSPTPWSGLNRRVVAAAGAIVAIVAWGATAWLLAEANQAKDPAAARVEAIKTGLGIGAGTGGVFALLLAVRRQWHQEATSVATELDASERRVTELYTKAADQLGSDKAPVRLAGLYALERVAQNNPDQRQTVINVLCAYLRMPYSVPTGNLIPIADREAFVEERERIQEREVRLAAQGIIANHLHSRPYLSPGEKQILTKFGKSNAVPATFWIGIRLDLTGATLVDFHLNHCFVQGATFDRARFYGKADFDRITVGRGTFSGAIFCEDASFHKATFSGVLFVDAVFSRAADFTEAEFHSVNHFRRANFEGRAFFRDITNMGFLDFTGARFAKGIPDEVKPFGEIVDASS